MHKRFTVLTLLLTLIVSLATLVPLNTVQAEELDLSLEKPEPVQGFRAYTNPGASITLKWNPVANADYYAIFYLGMQGEQNAFRTITANTHYTDLAPQEGFHFYRVFAVNKVGDQQIFSAGPTPNYVYAYSIPALPKPTVQVQSTSAGVQLSWNPIEDAEAYLILRKGPGEDGFSEYATTEGTTFLDEQVAPGECYFYILRAYRSFRDQRHLGHASDFVYGMALAKKEANTDKTTTPQTDDELDTETSEEDDTGEDREAVIEEETLEGTGTANWSQQAAANFGLADDGNLSATLNFDVNGTQIKQLQPSVMSDAQTVQINFYLYRPLFVGTQIQSICGDVKVNGRSLGRSQELMPGSNTTLTLSKDEVTGPITINVSYQLKPLDTTGMSADQVIELLVQEMDRMGLDTVGKIEYAYAYLRFTTNYSHANPRGWTPDGSLVDHVADCWGFSHGFAAIMDRLGIPAIVVKENNLHAGSELSSGVPHHSWDYVEVGGQWYRVDAVYGYNNYQEADDPALKMFLPQNKADLLRHSSLNLLKGGKANADDTKLYPELKKLSPVDFAYGHAFDLLTQ